MDAQPGVRPGRHAGTRKSEPAVAIVCADGWAHGWDERDPHARPFLLIAELLCGGLGVPSQISLKTEPTAPMRQVVGEEQR